jgi:hypothetical protein
MGNAIVPHDLEGCAIPMRALYEAHCEAKPKPC